MKQEGIALVAAVVFGAAWCVVAPSAVHGDPFAFFELASGTIIFVWATKLVSNVWRGQRMARELGRLSDRALIDGVEVRVVNGGGMMALVTGAIRPIVFLGDRLVAELDADERHAVVLHERHHSEIRAPLRAAALEGWIGLVGRIGAVRRVLEDRLIDLETMADAHALAHGASAAALAAAMLKTDRTTLGVAVGSRGAARRVEALLGDQLTPKRFQPAYEWLPIGVAVVAAAACHVLGLSIS